MVRQEHADVVVDEGSCSRKSIHRGVLLPHIVRRCGMHWGRGDLQIPGTDVGPVRRLLASGPLECWEDVSSLDPAK